MQLKGTIIGIANKALENEPMFMTPGHNGPYLDQETPVRNACHWLITHAYCWEQTAEPIFYKKVIELADYIVSKEARPNGYTFHYRNKDTKDKCNGLIGQAWTFEALSRAAGVLGDSYYLEVAQDVFSQHRFNHTLGLWHRLEIDGTFLEIDRAFNHQLWFAACASLLGTSRGNEVKNSLDQFMQCLPANMIVLRNGLIYHLIEGSLSNSPNGKFHYLSRLKRKVGPLRRSFKLRYGNNAFKKKYNEIVYKSVGYHSFNMYAFAILKKQLPNHPFWSTKKFRRTVGFMLSHEFENGLDGNPFSYAYNPPGWEVPVSLSNLSDLNQDRLLKISQKFVRTQFEKSYNPETKMFDRNTPDPVTLTARIYELTRLPQNLLCEIDVVN